MLDHAPLLRWYDAAKRDLPWRRTKDPYAIWVSEAMLQQTQVETVLPYWARWMTAFPTVEALAHADEHQVLTLWQGLGYYRRARLLLAGARWIVSQGMPTDVAGWRAVPGVGAYTAGAIASIAFGETAALVDGNVERVYSRIAADASSGPPLRRAAWRWAERNLDRSRPGDWNQALMELGATVCRPVKPACRICPLEEICVARQTWRTDEFPAKRPKPETVRLRTAVWIPAYQGRLGVRQVPQGEWWQGMWEFPRAVLSGDDSADVLRGVTGPGWARHVATFHHSVTHHRIRVDVAVIDVEQPGPLLQWRTVEELAALPMPSPQRKALRLAFEAGLLRD